MLSLVIANTATGPWAPCTALRLCSPVQYPPSFKGTLPLAKKSEGYSGSLEYPHTLFSVVGGIQTVPPSTTRGHSWV